MYSMYGRKSCVLFFVAHEKMLRTYVLMMCRLGLFYFFILLIIPHLLAFTLACRYWTRIQYAWGNKCRRVISRSSCVLCISTLGTRTVILL